MKPLTLGKNGVQKLRFPFICRPNKMHEVHEMDKMDLTDQIDDTDKIEETNDLDEMNEVGKSTKVIFFWVDFEK